LGDDAERNALGVVLGDDGDGGHSVYCEERIDAITFLRARAPQVGLQRGGDLAGAECQELLRGATLEEAVRADIRRGGQKCRFSVRARVRPQQEETENLHRAEVQRMLPIFLTSFFASAPFPCASLNRKLE